MTVEIHFVQGGEAPALVGAGVGKLDCACGNTLIEDYQPLQFLAISIQCARCGTVTTTPPLPEGKMLPAGVSTAEPSTEARMRAMKVPAGVAVVGRTEMERLGTLFRPVTPATSEYRISAALLDQAAAVFERHAGAALPEIERDPADAFTGVREHALAWAVRHLRGRAEDGGWACMEAAATSDAVLHVTAFLHFAATWSRHPLFPTMFATAADRGFSLHGLALFAAAHCLALTRNRVGFQQPATYPHRIETFDLATGATGVVPVQMDVFDRFEYPFGEPWDAASLRAAVSDVVAAAQSRINLRNPGLLLMSPGTALLGYDEALIEAVKAALQILGRKNRGLMAVAPIALRIQPMPDPHTVRFGYLLYPVANRHYSGDSPIQVGA